MIYAGSARGSVGEFEALLEDSVGKLSTTLNVLGKMSNDDFEEAVKNAMNASSEGTPFKGKISRTDLRDFPDITADTIYGVEVKKTTKSEFKTTGNSVFEQARVPGVEHVYLVMANDIKAIWKNYESVLANIIVTHSPRYAINVDCTETVFERMGTDYETFRKMPQEEKMKEVRSLYSDSSLWWVAVEDGGTPPWRFWGGLSPVEKNEFRIEALALCPEGLSKTSTAKFRNIAVLALSRGIVIPNVRDLLSAGGTTKIKGRTLPRIMGHVRDLKDDIRDYFETVDTELLAAFWDETIPGKPEEKWNRWVSLARGYAGEDIDIALDL